MPKIIIANVTGGFNLQTDINARLQQIALALNNDVLWRRNIVGESNNMTASLDMNGLAIDNAGAVSSTGLTVDGNDVGQNIELMGTTLQTSVDAAVAANTSFVNNVGAAVAAAEGARDDSRTAETGSQTAETNAKTSETNAVAAKNAAQTAASSAANDAIAAVAGTLTQAANSATAAAASAVTAAAQASTATTQASAASSSASAAAISESGAEADRIQTGIWEASVQNMIAALPDGVIGTGDDDAITNAAARDLLSGAGGSSLHSKVVTMTTPANGSTKVLANGDLKAGEVTHFAYSGMGNFNSVTLSIPNGSTVSELRDHNAIAVSKVGANGTVNIVAAANVTISGHTVMSDQGVVTLRRVATDPGGDVYVSTFEPLSPSAVSPLSDNAIAAGISTTAGTVNPVQLAGLSGPGENLIINGDFAAWQRGTSQLTAVDGYGSSDRWHNQRYLSSRSVYRQDFTAGQTDVPGNPAFFKRTQFTTGGAGYALTKMAQLVEDVSRLGGETVTLSFWAKSNTTAKPIAVEFEQFFGTSGASAEITGIGGQSITIGTTWAKYTHTVAVPSTASKTITAGNHTKINIWFDAAAEYNSRVDSLGPQTGNMDIAMVKLEFGSAATDFIPELPGETLRKCKRYFERMGGDAGLQRVIGSGMGFGNGGGNIRCPIVFEPKRAKPTITHAGNFEAVIGSTSGIISDAVANFSSFPHEQGTAYVAFTPNNTVAQEGAIIMRTKPGVGNYIDIDAEL